MRGANADSRGVGGMAPCFNKALAAPSTRRFDGNNSTGGDACVSIPRADNHRVAAKGTTRRLKSRCAREAMEKEKRQEEAIRCEITGSLSTLTLNAFLSFPFPLSPLTLLLFLAIHGGGLLTTGLAERCVRPQRD